MIQNGKGDSPRPLSVDKETFYDNWDRIFSNNDEIDTCAYSGLPAVHTYDTENMEDNDATSTQESS